MKRTIFLAVSSLLLYLSASGASPYRPLRMIRWRCSALTVALDGTAIPIDADYILLYYAADWCPYCIAYTEQLKSPTRRCAASTAARSTSPSSATSMIRPTSN